MKLIIALLLICAYAQAETNQKDNYYESITKGVDYLIEDNREINSIISTIQIDSKIQSERIEKLESDDKKQTSDNNSIKKSIERNKLKIKHLQIARSDENGKEILNNKILDIQRRLISLEQNSTKTSEMNKIKSEIDKIKDLIKKDNSKITYSKELQQKMLKMQGGK